MVQASEVRCRYVQMSSCLLFAMAKPALWFRCDSDRIFEIPGSISLSKTTKMSPHSHLLRLYR